MKQCSKCTPTELLRDVAASWILRHSAVNVPQKIRTYAQASGGMRWSGQPKQWCAVPESGGHYLFGVKIYVL